MDEPEFGSSVKRAQSLDEEIFRKRRNTYEPKKSTDDSKEELLTDMPTFSGGYHAFHRLRRQRHASDPEPSKPPEFQIKENFNENELQAFMTKIQEYSSDKLFKIFEEMKQNDVDLNTQASDTNNTFIHAACQVPHRQEILHQIMKFKVNTKLKNNDLELPIHIAIKYDHVRCVELLLQYDKSLLYSFDKKGFGLIHKASQHLAINSIRLLRSMDPGSINTYPKNKDFSSASVLHIAIGSYQALGQHIITDHTQTTKLISDQQLLRQISRVSSNKKMTLQNMIIFDINSIFLEVCSKDILAPRNNSSVIHKLIDIQDIDGIKLILKRFESDSEFVPSFINAPNLTTEKSPLLKAIDLNHIDIATLLVRNGANPNSQITSTGDHRGYTATERAIQLCRDPHDVEPLLRELIKQGAEILPALEAVIDTGDISLARAIFDEVTRPHLYINHQDVISGETILHSCLSSFSLQNEVEDILYLIEKGANIMTPKLEIPFAKANSLESVEMKDQRYSIEKVLPIHLAIDFYTNDGGEKRVTSYLTALRRFGISRLFENIRTESERREFFLSHLLPAAYFVDYIFVDELLTIMFSLKLPALSNIVTHHQNPCSPFEMYQHPLLHWATFHHHIPLMHIVVKAEYNTHEQDKENGFECFRRLGNNPLREQAGVTYTQMFSKSPKWGSKVIPVLFEIVFRLYLMFILDIYFDIDLAYEYSRISDYVQHIGNQSYIEFDFFDEANFIIEDVNRTGGSNRYFIGQYLSIILIAPSIVAFFVMAYANFSIADDIQRLSNQYPSCKIEKYRYLIYPLKPPLFLCSHVIRAIQSKAQPYDPYIRQKYDAGRKAWELIRRVEIGVEASGQLILQLYLLSPLSSHILRVSKQRILSHIWKGIGFYVTLSTLSATFAEKMGAKFLISSLTICASITRYRLLKNSATGLCRNGHYEAILCYFASCVTQLLSRSITLLLLFTVVNISPNLILFFIVGHWALTIIIKVVLEVPPKGRYPNLKSNIRGKVSATFNIFTSSVLSTIIYVPMPKSDNYSISRDPNEVNTFLPSIVYQLLVLLEHVLLAGVTNERTIEIYNEYCHVFWFAPVGLWVLNLVLLTLYYKVMHRSKNLERIGPKIKGAEIEHKAVVCFDMKHFYLNCRTCSCSVETVTAKNQCAEKKTIISNFQ